MNICCTSTQLMSTSKLVTSIGKYIYKNVEGAISQKSMPNSYEVRILVLYEIPKLQRRVGYKEDQDLNEMIINLNLTTYKNKIRVNLIEETPEEQTLGYDLYEPDKLMNPSIARDRILEKVYTRLKKRFSEYEFVF